MESNLFTPPPVPEKLPKTVLEAFNAGQRSVLDARNIALEEVATLRARVAELEGKSEREHSSRVFYQDLVYKACNVVDEALGRCVGNGTRTSDVGMPDGVREMASRLYAKLAWRYAHDCARKYVVACDVYRGALPASDGGRGPSPSDLASLWQKWDEARKDAEHADELAKKDALAGKDGAK